MSDKATMLRETDEAFADLRTMLDWLTEEQASRVWPGVQDSLNQIREYPVQNRDWRAARSSQTGESTRAARSLWAPGSFWGLRYPSKPDGNNVSRSTVTESPPTSSQTSRKMLKPTRWRLAARVPTQSASAWP